MFTVLEILYIGPVAVGAILLAISVIYFIAGRPQPISRRIFKCSHGILYLGLMYPVLIDKFSLLTKAGWMNYPFWIFLFLGISSTTHSLAGHARHWSLHFLHIFTIFYGALAALYGMHGLAL